MIEVSVTVHTSSILQMFWTCDNLNVIKKNVEMHVSIVELRS